jgi:hypothetical protein
MAQADPNVGSGTGGAVRTGLVAGLLALFSRNSGTTYPSYKVLGTDCLRTDIPGTGVGTVQVYDGVSWLDFFKIDTTSHLLTLLARLGSAVADAYTTTAANVNAQTGTSYTLVAADNGKTVTMSNAAASVLTVPSGLPTGFSCAVVQLGAGQVTITASGTTLRNRNGLKMGGQYAQAGLLFVSTDTYSVGGDLST